MKFTDIDLIKNGKSDYLIVIPDNPTFYEKHAVSELNEYLYRSTGLKLPVICESEASINADSKYLLIGETKAVGEREIIKTRIDLGLQGLKIKRKDANAFIYGGSDVGALYGVYEFLHQQFGYELYTPDEIYLERKVRDKKLIDFDFEDKPDFALRQAYVNPKYFRSAIDAHKLRLTIFKEIFINDSPQPWHNTFAYFPKEEYQEKHPKWYTDDGRQLHYTAHGDKAELKALSDALYEKMIACIERDFSEGRYFDLIGFMQQDENIWAEDESINEYKEKYGEAYPAATLIHFLNPIARRLKEYMAKNHPGRTMNIVTFAYNKTEPAPVKEVDGKYLPIDDSVIPEDNIMMFIAPVDADYTNDFNHERNAKYMRTIDKWKVLSKHLSFWIYSKYHSNNMMFYDFIDSIPSIYRMIKDANGYYVFNEMGVNYGNTVFNAAKEYVCAKLMWNTSLDEWALLKDFFKHYYKDASDKMLEFYSDVRKIYRKIENENEMRHTIFDIMDKKEYWDLDVLNEFIAKGEDILKTIEHYKIDNPELYDVLYKRICGDTVSFRYIKMLNYPEEYGVLERRIEKEAIRSIYTQINVCVYTNVKKDLVELWKLWGLQ